MSKQKSKYNRNTDSESDPDDPPLQLDEDSHIKSEPKIKPTTLFKKKEIIPYTDDEIKEKFKYKRHKCALDYLPTKNGRPIGKCRKGRPAELKVDEVKLHYVVWTICTYITSAKRLGGGKDKGGLRPLVESNRHMTHIDFTNFLKIG